jgi:hypothetical protein
MRNLKLYRLSGVLLLVALWLGAQFLCPRPARAQRAQEDFFEGRVRPLLAAHCYDCHTDQPKGGLRVDSREALLKGGSAIVVGEADKSRLIHAVTHQHPTLRMKARRN